MEESKNQLLFYFDSYLFESGLAVPNIPKKRKEKKL